MKKFLTIVSLLFSVLVFSQSGDDVVNALKNVDAVKFTNYFDNSVDIVLNKKESKGLSKSDAASAIQSFFEKNQIKSFELISTPRELNGTMYVAGKLTGASQTYNITVMLKSKGSGMLVITIRIS